MKPENKNRTHQGHMEIDMKYFGAGKHHPMILPPHFFRRDSDIVARELLGKKLIILSGSTCLSGIINETEAYRGQDDPASHAYLRVTGRNRSMYETYGHVYV